MCRVFASHTCPVCSRRGRHIVRWENEMAKQSLLKSMKRSARCIITNGA